MRELVCLLAEHNIGALVVSADGSSVDGIVSERDVVRRLNEDEAVLDAPVSRDHVRRGADLRDRLRPSTS